MALPETATQAEFARLLGYKRSYVTALKQAGRLVLAEDGAVRVAESIARIEATRDPGKAAVAERHAAARAVLPALVPDLTPADAEPESSTQGYQYWRERRERANALAAERDNAEAEGKLLRTADVVAACAGAFVIARVALESLADTLGPQLAAEGDEARCRALIADEVELQLAELSRRLGAMEPAL